MAVINFVVPKLSERTFSGGIYCIFQYALGLRRRGHQVNIVPLLPSPRPRWINGDYGHLPDGSDWAMTRQVFREIGGLIAGRFEVSPAKTKSRVIKQRIISALGFRFPKLASPLLQRGLSIEYVSQNMPNADVTIATSCETALAVKLYGAGKKFYFAQHFEPYFCAESWNPLLAELEALQSYNLGLNVIANSTWLARKLESSVGMTSVRICVNAIDAEIFYGAPKQSPLLDEIKIISYGGRNANWKGFSEMAEGVRLARLALPHKALRWQVYGDALLPPDNPIASYEWLGFLQQSDLSNAYRNADLLLSASWYESFPLFPIEAMACGLPVITTMPGTEDYVIPDITAAVVEPKDPKGIALAIQRLVTDPVYRYSLAVDGQNKAKEFSWDKSIRCMEALLLEG